MSTFSKSVNLEDQYQRLLKDYCETTTVRTKSSCVCLFQAHWKKDWDGDLMVVGRAVNGWGKKGFAAEEYRDTKKQKKLLQDLAIDDEANPMETAFKRMNSEPKYNWRKSAFWRVVFKLKTPDNLLSLYPNDWVPNVVWSNLYKIAPFEGGNPGDLMCRAQQEACVELLKAELTEFRPRRVLFMTDYEDWLTWDDHGDKPSFSEGLKMRKQSDRSYNFVKFFGNASFDGKKDIPTVVIPHPQGKPEMEICNEVSDAFEKLGV